MKKSIIGLSAVAALTVAGSAAAQICAGFPTVDRQISLGGNVYFPEDASAYGVEASYNAPGPLAVNAGLLVTDVEDLPGLEIDPVNTYQAAVALEVPSLGAALGGRPTVCPVIGFSYTDLEGSSNITQVPVGLGIGVDLNAGGFTVSPYVVPQIVWTRFNFEEIAIEQDDDIDDSSTDFVLKGGALLGIGRMFYVGGEVQKAFGEENDTDPVFGIRAGVRF